MNQRWTRGLPYLPALVVFGIFLPFVGNGFINWDDPVAIQYNLHLRSLSWENIRWMFTSLHMGAWYPLTWFSLSLDVNLFGLRPLAFHLHNLLLHAVNTTLVYLLALRLVRSGGIQTAWAPFLAAILFGLHPLHVGSVLWANERTDLLCGLFYLVALVLYLGRPREGEGARPPLGACLAAFALALASKPMAVSLPFLLLVLDRWPLGRPLGPCLREKWAFFLLSGMGAILAFFAKVHSDSLPSIRTLSVVERFWNAVHALGFYLWKMVLPTGLSILHPIGRSGQVPGPSHILILLGSVILGVLAYRWRRERPWLPAALTGYLLVLLPVLGLLQAGAQSAADRYTYLGALSPFLLFSIAAGRLLEGRGWAGPLGAASLTLVLALLSHSYAPVWKDSVSVWENAARIHPDRSAIIHERLGNAYLAAGRYAEGLGEYDRAARLAPRHPFVRDGRGSALFALGRWEEAEREFREAVSLDPSYAQAHSDLAGLKLHQGDLAGAVQEAGTAAGLDPGSPEPFNILGIAYGSMGRSRESEEALERAVELDPGNERYRENLEITRKKMAPLNR